MILCSPQSIGDRTEVRAVGRLDSDGWTVLSVDPGAFEGLVRDVLGQDVALAKDVGGLAAHVYKKTIFYEKKKYILTGAGIKLNSSDSASPVGAAVGKVDILGRVIKLLHDPGIVGFSKDIGGSITVEAI